MWLLRLIIGGIFVASGLSKLLAPYQNFLYVIQAYELLPSKAELITAQVLPWIEFLTGVFVFLGMWTSRSLIAAMGLFALFMVVVGQALVRKLPLENCGCFGGWVHLTPQTDILVNSLGLVAAAFLLSRLGQTKKFSLDAYFDKV